MLPLVGRAVSPSTSSNSALSTVLNADGTLQANAHGSFDAHGYTMSTAPSGQPTFRPATTHRTQGTGDERWQDGFGLPGANNNVYAVARATNGDLYVGGSFTAVGTVPANRVAKWNGTAWSTLGTGINNNVLALALDGNGNLYAGGNFTTAGGTAANYVARWDGIAWNPLGAGLSNIVRALALDGNGNLYAGGNFTTVGSGTSSRVACWNGTTWSTLGTGTTNGDVYALAVDGSGTVYAGGNFSSIGGVSASSLAKWSGTAWSPLGTGLNGTVYALAAAGAGTVYAGGSFSKAGTLSVANVARWNGTVWSTLGTGTSNTTNTSANGGVYALALDGNGNLYAGGSFNTAGSTTVNRLAKWDGSAWSAFGTGLNSVTNSSTVYALALGSSGSVSAGGSFTTAGSTATLRVAQWNGTAWSALGTGVNSSVYALALDGSGNVYIGGNFTAVGGAAARYVAKWDGTSWSALGAGLGNVVYTLAVDGSGSLYAGGIFTTAGSAAANYVAKWDGTAWSPLGTGLSNYVRTLVADGNGTVYAGGDFTTAGGVAAAYAAKWNGTAWSALGTGLNNSVNKLAVDGSGSLYAGGSFTTAGSAVANYIAKWDGTAWSPLGLGLDNVVLTLAVSGSSVYAGGVFTNAGGAAASYVAKWDGTAWSPLGTGPNGYGRALVSDGSGGVYAGGDFTTAGGAAVNYVAQWNGTTWNALGTGLNSSVYALTLGNTGNVYAGGSFTAVGDNSKVTASFGIYRAIAPTLTALSPAAELPGMPVTLTGTDFVSGSTVSFGGVAAPSVTFTSATSLTAVVPAGAAVGASSVIVTTPAGSSSTSPVFTVLKVHEAPTTTCPTTVPYTSTGDGQWHYLLTSAGDVVAALQDTRAALGSVSVSYQVSDPAAPVRQDGGGHPYFDRNFRLTATASTFPGSVVNVRFYGLTSEFAHLQAADAAASYATLNATQYSGANEDCNLANDDFAGGSFRSLAAPANTPGSGMPWFVAQVAVADHFSEFYLSSRSAPLPVQLTTFTATTQGGVVRLAWATASEESSARFEVERSPEGVTFGKIGEVAAAGTAATTHHYGFTDATLPTGARVLYYRLRQVDLDGTFSYSPVRAAALGRAELVLSPNPASGHVATLSGATPGQVVQVLDAVGRLVLSATADTSGTTGLALPASLPSGMYVVRVGAQAVRLAVE